MKKLIKIVTIVLLVFIFSACASGKIITKENFEEKLADLKFNTKDVTKEIDDSSISKAVIASNNKVQVEFYVFKSEDSALNAYNNNKKDFEENKDYKVKEVKKENYTKSTQTTKDFYNVVIKSGNIVIYSSVNVNYKRDVKKLISKIGY